MQAALAKFKLFWKREREKESVSFGGLSSESHFLDYFLPDVIIVTTAANSLVKKGSSYFHKVKFILLNYLKSLLSLLSLNGPVIYFTIEVEIRK